MRKSKGITLIALIITIVVLLILAVVAIGAIQNDGIIEHAKNARDKYQLAQGKENIALANYLAKIENNYPNVDNDEEDEEVSVSLVGPGPWTQNKMVLTNTNGDTINVGDTVAYDETKGGTVRVKKDTNWKVLGAENGKILLMSTTDVGEVELYGSDDYYNDEGIGKINAACEGYNKGTGAAEGINSRSIKIEDIDRITGFDKTTYGKGEIHEYGNEVIYTLGTDGDTVTVTVKGKPDLKNTFSLEVDYLGKFCKPDMKDLAAGESYEAEQNTSYEYQGKTYFQNTTNDPVYAMIFRNEANTANASYWLGSSMAGGKENVAFLGVRCVWLGKVSDAFLWSSNHDEFGGEQYWSHGVRAVVSLVSDIQLEANGTNAWKIVEKN